MLLVFTNCLEPPRDNPYDPNNPDKGNLTGIAYDYKWDVLEGVLVKLKLGEDIIYSTVTNSEGRYEFDSVAANYYTLYAEADYYHSLYIDMEIRSDTYDTLDLYFDELCFHFDNEVVNTPEPFDFKILFGTWKIMEDWGEPSEHSTPNVYNGVHTGSSGDPALSVFSDTLQDFWVSTHVKILGSSSTWYAGIALRYQDVANYYWLELRTDGLAVMKILNGNVSQLELYSTVSFTTDTWYHIGADVYDNKIKVYLDYTELFEVQDTSSPFYSGLTGFWIYTSEPTGSAAANFDDVHITPEYAKRQ
jgi:hypothetical protein